MCKNGSRANNSVSDSNFVYSPPSCDDTIVSKDFINSKLQLVFGATILWNDGGSFDEPWGTWWLRACCISDSLYDLPGGAVGREFVDLLTDEICMLTKNTTVSDRLMMLCPVVLQRNCMVRVGSDVRCLLRRRMQL